MKSAERKSAFIESTLHDDPREEALERLGQVYGMDTTLITVPSDSHESFTRVVAWGANLDPADFGVIP